MAFCSLEKKGQREAHVGYHGHVHIPSKVEKKKLSDRAIDKLLPLQFKSF